MDPIFFITETIRAQRNAWLVGDEFLRKNYHAYPALRAEAVVNNRPAPYVFSNYNVSTFTSAEKLLRNPMTRMLNCFIEALNKYHVLPRFIIIIPDWDIVKFIDYSRYGISKMLGMCLEWLVGEFEKALSIKKEDMRQVRPGSVVSLEPKFIWVKMIERGGKSKNLDRFMEVGEKYNAVLEQTLYKTRNMYVMGIERKSIDNSCFELCSNLNSRGKACYWAEFDRIVRKFDKQEITLKPLPVCEKTKKN